jgi:hypothetical protein
MLDWQLVHRGQLPLWNSLSGTGLPQLFNFESAPLSIATIAGYLAPLSMSFLVTVAAKMLIAGTGVYVLCRGLGAGAVASALGGTTFMLSGSFSSWLGWSVGGPVALGGWILAAALLAYRSRRQVRQLLLLAAAVGFSLYAGFPESYVLLAIGLGVVAAASTLAAWCSHRSLSLAGIARVVAGVIAGGALAAPLLLPGASIIAGSARRHEVAAPGIPAHFASLLFAQGFFGLPIKGSTWFGSVNYYETTAYIGVIAAALALVAVLVSWRRPVVVGLLCSIVVALFMIYRVGNGNPLQRFLAELGLGSIALQRMQVVFELLLAVLAAIGLDTLLRRWRERTVFASFLGSTLALVAVLAVLWSKVASARMPPTASVTQSSIATLQSLRRSSLIWPTATAALLLVLVAATWALRQLGDERAVRAARVGALALLVAQSAYLLFAGIGINSYSHDPFPVTPAVQTIQKTVGTALLGLDGGNDDCSAAAPHSGRYCGVRLWRRVGFSPEINIAYGVDELGMHDPTIPQSYFDAWPIANSDPSESLNLFAPDIDTVALAHRYGVAFVLAGRGIPPPTGMRQVATVAGEALYAVPDAARFSFLGPASTATVVSVAHPSDARYVLRVKVARTSQLALRITAVTGWHASEDGKSLAVRRAAGDLLAVEVPAGTHEVDLVYWPAGFTLGLLVAAGALLGLFASAIVFRVRRCR